MEHRSLRFKQIASTGILLVAAIIWGMCFVAQRSGMEHIGPFLFNGVREILGSLTLLVVLLVVWLVTRIKKAQAAQQSDRPGASSTLRPIKTKEGEGISGGEPALTGSSFGSEVLSGGFSKDNSSRSVEEYGVIVEPGFPVTLEGKAHTRFSQESPKIGMRYILVAGIACGIALFFASNLQQVGMVTVTASKAAFITTLYIVLVPLLGIFLRHKTRWNTWVSVGIAVIGLYFLCVGDSLMLEPGDAVLLLGALFWAIHILAVGHYAPRLTLLQLFGMCVIQFALAGVLSLIGAFFFDSLFIQTAATLEAIAFVAPELLYAGMLSTAGAFTFAAVGQRYAKPTPAAIVMSTESVFGLLGGVFILGELLAPIEGLGCVLMMVAVILTQLSPAKRKRAKHDSTDSS